VVSPQSKVIANRSVLEKKVELLEIKYPDDSTIPRPAGWGGYVLKPTYFEFWQGRSSRLHDRITYSLSKGKWKISRIAP
jgi:pyridoxine/pyridoxamine 5'-phosphate oxidase